MAYSLYKQTKISAESTVQYIAITLGVHSKFARMSNVRKNAPTQLAGARGTKSVKPFVYLVYVKLPRCIAAAGGEVGGLIAPAGEQI